MQEVQSVVPPTPIQLYLEFWWTHPENNNVNALIADGAIRTGKTVWMSLGYIQWAMNQFNGFKFIMAGRTIASLMRNVIKDLMERLARLGYSITYKKNDNMMIIKLGNVTNEFHFFGGKDAGSFTLVQGLTAAGAYFDEVALMPESFVNQATGRCLSVHGHKFWFNCNPGNPFHFFKTEWIDNLKKKRAIHVHLTMHDNPILTEQDIEDAKNMYTGAFYERYILGNWVSADGLVFSNFDEDKMTVDKIPDGVNIKYYNITCDYGIYHPTVFEKWGYGTDGIWYLVDLYYFDGSKVQVQKSDKDYADDFVNFTFGLKIHRIIIDPSASSFIKELQSRGFRQCVKAINDVNNGIRLTQMRMDDGSFKIVNKQNMKPLLKELSTYCWDTKAAENGVDSVVKKFDHACDAMRYQVAFAMPIKNKSNGVQMFKQF